ncbi:MAG: zinc ribbon domain-containing protein, partial [Halobacteriota archaeon]
MKHVEKDLCSRCGVPTSQGAKYCESCGALLDADAAHSEKPVFAPAAGYQAPRQYVPRVGPQHQGVAIRFVAILIDYVIIAIIAGVLSAPFTALAVVSDSVSGVVTLSLGSAIG